MKTWKRWAWMLPFYLGALFLQPALQQLLPTAGRQMHLILAISVVLLFLYEESVGGLVLGAVFSLIWDLVFGMYAGPGMVSLLAAGGVVLLLRQVANRENFVNMLLTLVLTTWLYLSVYWGIYAALGSPYSYLYAMRTLPPALAWNCGVGMVLYAIWRSRVIRHRRDRYFK